MYMIPFEEKTLCDNIVRMKKSMTVVYPVGSGLYVNLTNKCPCNCTFCIRQSAKNEFDHIETLWLEHEPSFEEVVQALENAGVPSYKEVVFCGYGEPTEALDVLYTSETFERLQDTATGFYFQSVGYVSSFLKNEVENATFS